MISVGEVQEAESIFLAATLRDIHKRQTETVLAPRPVLTDYTPEQRAACNNDIGCLFDLAATRSREFAMKTLEANQTFIKQTETFSKCAFNIMHITAYLSWWY